MTTSWSQNLQFPSTPTAWEELLLQLLGTSLTAAERRVCARRVLGYSDAEIAEELVVTKAAVKTHTAHILDKFDLASVRRLPYHIFARLWERYRWRGA